MNQMEYEIHYGYNGVNSAHYALQGFTNINKVLKTMDKILEDSSYSYCYVIRVIREKIFYKDLINERRKGL